MIRQIKKETLKELIKVYLKYWKTDDVDLLDKKINLSRDLSIQSFSNEKSLFLFSDIVGALTFEKVYRGLKITYETIYKVFEMIGFEIVDKEIPTQQSFELKEVDNAEPLQNRDLELEVYEELCVGCSDEKMCHEECEHCVQFYERLEEKENED